MHGAVFKEEKPRTQSNVCRYQVPTAMSTRSLFMMLLKWISRMSQGLCMSLAWQLTAGNSIMFGMLIMPWSFQQQQLMMVVCTATDLMPDTIVTQIKDLTEKLKVVGGADTLSVEAQRNATFMFFSLLRQTFASKRVLNELRLNDAAFRWIIGEIHSRFNQVGGCGAILCKPA